MTKQNSYGFIGGNPLDTRFGYDTENEEFLKFRKLLSELISKLDGEIHTCANAGIELACGECAVENDKELVCVMPFEEQAAKWCPCQREHFFNLHAKAQKVEILSKKYYPECESFATNHIIESCDHLVYIGSLHKPLPVEIKNAMERGKPTTIINCDDFTIKADV